MRVYLRLKVEAWSNLVEFEIRSVLDSKVLRS